MKTITILGGYGTFGNLISKRLAQHPGVHIRVAGRNAQIGKKFADSIGADFCTCDVNDRSSLQKAIEDSYIVINTAGPFQSRDYRVAETSVECGSHYLDIADAREYVTGITALDEIARERGLFVISGASLVPAITFAMVEELGKEFTKVNSITAALSAGNKNPRGGATVEMILSGVGLPFRVWREGAWTECFGWGDKLHFPFPQPVGSRWVFMWSVPDLDIFPKEWNARTVLFYSGMELNFFNFGLYLLAKLRRNRHMQHLRFPARLFRSLSKLFFMFGSGKGAIAVRVQGQGHTGMQIERRLALVAQQDGPEIPSTPAVIIAKKILDQRPPRAGAFPCVGFHTFTELMAELAPFTIQGVRGTVDGWNPIESYGKP